MARTYKDNPGYLKNIKKKKERRSEKYHRHKSGDDLDLIDSLKINTCREPYYKCIERKLPIFYEDDFLIEDLLDQLDSINDFENEAA